MAQRRTKSSRPSLAEVAAIAGVSISTVSKVANNGADVSDITRERVERILQDRGYVATKKRRGSLTPLVILARDLYSPYTLDVIRGVVYAAGPAQLDISISVYPDDPDDLSWIDEVHAAGKRGVIAITSVLDEKQRARFDEHDMPLVVIDPFNSPDENTYSVGATNWAGGLEATEYLLGLGHRRIVMLSGLPTAMASRARMSGYLAALNDAGLPHDPPRVVSGDFTYDSGLAEGLEILAEPDRPTAIIAASDFQALGVLEAARRLGVQVPEELSLIGFDDLVVAQMTSPPLTSVRQPLDQMGAAAVDIIVALISGAASRPHHTELATRLVVRGSTAAPKA